MFCYFTWNNKNPIFLHRLFTFPTERENPEGRMIWRELLNRREPSNKNLLWSPSRHKQSRMCSIHFPDGMPTKTNPYPTLFLNNDVDVDLAIGKKSKTTRRRLTYNNDDNDAVVPDPVAFPDPVAVPDSIVVPDPTDAPNLCNDSSLAIDFDVFGNVPSTRDESPSEPIINNANRQCLFLPSFFVFRHGTYRNMFFSCMVTVASLLCFGWMLKSKYFAALREINKLKNDLQKKELLLTRLRSNCKVLRLENQKLKKDCICKLPIHEVTIKDDKSCLFYTGIEKVSTFNKLFDFIFPFVKRRWVGFKFTSTILKRKFSKIPKRMGPERKLCGKDEFLMLLMKLRLALLEKDLANRFKVSLTTTSRIVRTWLKVTSSILQSFVFIPDQGTLNVTKPPVFKSISNLHSIIDATELFIETPKGLINQRLTWSNYKHHNTLKVLVAVSSNSSVVFISNAYVGGISDKALTLHTDYLSLVPPHTTLMADKGFNILDECNERSIHLKVPPGRRGVSQMSAAALKTTCSIAKLRIIVEQVIGEIKTFRILSQEIPISLIPQVDDILIICSALTNLKKPIYK